MLFLLLTACRVPLDFDPKPKQPSGRELLERLSADSSAPLPPITRVDVLAVGVLTRIPEGARASTDDFCPDTHRQVGLATQFIKAELLNEFGFEFVLLPAASTADRAVTAPVTVRVQHPPIRNPITGRVEQEHSTLTLACLGKRSNAGWQFDAEWELVNGNWTVELLYQGQVLATRSFTVQGGLPEVGVEKQLTRTAGQSVSAAPAPDARLKGAGTDARAAAVWKPAGKATGIAVLVSSNRNPEFAREAVRSYMAAGYPARIGLYRDPRDNSLWHTVLLGDFPDTAAARQAAAFYREREGREAFVVAAASHSAGQRPETLAPSQARDYVSAAPEAVKPTAGRGAHSPATQSKSPVAREKSRKEGPPPRITEAGGEAAVAGTFVVQAASFLDQVNATAYQAELRGKGWKNARLVSYRDASGRLWHSVRLGPYPSRSAAAAAAAEFREREGRNVIVLPVAP